MRLGTRHTIWLLLLLLAPFGLLADDDAFEIENFDDSPRIRVIEYPEWFKLSFLDLQEDLTEAVEHGKNGIIVYFGQKHCAYCAALMEVNFGKEEDIVRYTREHFDVMSIDIWGSREVIDMKGEEVTEGEFAEREEMSFTPSLIFYDKQGREALRLRGFYPPYTFRAALEYVVDGYYRKESLRDYLARADPPPKFDVGEMNSREFFIEPPYALDRSRFPAEQPLVVFFEQRECHACDVLHTGPLGDLETEMLLDSFEAVQLDMWSDQPVLTPDGQRLTASQWARQLGLFYAPALVFFDEKGREIIKVDSVVRLYRLQGVLEYVLCKGYIDTPSFQRWRRLWKR
jgi:thioredoxin-related protein